MLRDGYAVVLTLRISVTSSKTLRKGDTVKCQAWPGLNESRA